MIMYHNPVLLKSSVDGLDINPSGIYVDVTFGGGGHSREILNRLGRDGKLYAFDQDKDVLLNKIEDRRLEFISANFRYLMRYLNFLGVRKVDGILADFGISSHQIDVPSRGFSTRFDSELDMRMNNSEGLSAKDILRDYSIEDMTRLFREYAELRQAFKLSRLIVIEREKKAIETTAQLASLVKQIANPKREAKVLAQVFQALRIEVNDEMGVVKEFLLQTPNLLSQGGRLSVISYHSLEDRLVKRYIRDGKFEGQAEKDMYGNIRVPFKKIGGLIVPSEEEVLNNNRARSAKLRVAERICQV